MAVKNQFERQQRNVNFMFPNSSPGQEPFLTYVALMLQNGTSNPVATIIRNTFGFIPVWQRTGVGIYTFTETRMFDEAKVFISVSLPGPGLGSRVILGERTSNDVLTFKTTIDGSYQDGLLDETALEIRIYA